MTPLEGFNQALVYAAETNSSESSIAELPDGIVLGAQLERILLVTWAVPI